jgi:hypothetical protein
MAKPPSNHGRDWTPAQDRQLKQLVRENTPTRVMGFKLGRTPGAVQQHANDLGLSTPEPVQQAEEVSDGRLAR